MNLAEHPPVTLCPTGKRALRRPPPTGERILAPLVQEERLTDLQEERLRKHNLAVALAQPHRVGMRQPDDPRLAFPLGRFCAARWPNDRPFGDKMYSAGIEYASDVRAVRVARGFHHASCEARKGVQPALGDPTPAEIEAMKGQIFAVERALEKADELLREVMRRCPAAMVRLCYDDEEPSLYDLDMLRNGLYRLSLHYGKWEKPLNGR